MDEAAYLSTLTNFFQSALNWATPNGAPSVPSSGTPQIALGAGTFDLSSANATTQGSSNWLSAVQGNYNTDFAFMTNTFNQSTAFLQPVLKQVNDGVTQIGGQYAQAMQSYANALNTLANNSGGGFLSSIF